MKILIYTLFLALFLSSCLKKDEANEKNPEFDIKKRQEQAARQGGGLFNLGKKDVDDNLTKSNVLWKATLKTLDFLPLTSIDYAGGLIVTDWYSGKNNEQIKIQVRFLSPDLKSSSIEVTSFKKICNANGVCQNSEISNNFNKEIKDSIINTARIIKIDEEKKKN